jgi:hypothetical protein
MHRERRFQESVAPHPEVVTETSRRLLDDPSSDPFRWQPGRSARSESRNGAVESLTFNPIVYQHALAAAGGDVKRLIAYSLKDIRVLNRPRPDGVDIWGRDRAGNSWR